MLQWFVDEKVAISAVKDSCRLIEEEEVKVRPEKLRDATIDDNIDVYLIRKYFNNNVLLRIVFKNSGIQYIETKTIFFLDSPSSFLSDKKINY